LNRLGWLGGIFLALCPLPEVYQALVSGTCNISFGMLSMWGLGEILVFISVTRINAAGISMGFLLFNYGINIICICFLFFIKVYGF
jgi:hypothetical protein